MYDYGRWWAALRLCEWCAKDQDVVRSRLRRFLPESTDGTEEPPGKARIDVYAARVAAGLSCFSDADKVYPHDPIQLAKVGRGDWQADPGETGVERQGKRFRVRPMWRGRKWKLGTFPSREKAVERAKAFWDIRKGDPGGVPPVWMPCGDEEGAFAVEEEMLAEWLKTIPLVRKPLVTPLAVCKRLAAEVAKMRPRPAMPAVFAELQRRMEALAAGREPQACWREPVLSSAAADGEPAEAGIMAV